MHGQQPSNADVPIDRAPLGLAARAFAARRIETLITRTPGRPALSVARLQHDAPPLLSAPLPAHDGFLLCVQLKDETRIQLYERGFPTSCHVRMRHSIGLTDLSAGVAFRIDTPFDAVVFHLPQAALDAFAAAAGQPPVRLMPIAAADDEVVARLTLLLLPVLERERAEDTLFADCLVFAIAAHVMRTYGVADTSTARRGGLAGWRLRRAKELLSETAVPRPIAEIAAACRLSRGHFIRAFRLSTGLTPHRWLQAHRIGRARELLLETTLATAEIAAICGFADQSHLTRSFTRAVGKSPAAWRREHR